MTDPIADMLTRIRNATMRGNAEVVLPHSKIKAAIAELMQTRGYLAGVKTIQNGVFTTLALQLPADGTISNIRRISKPGRRIYAPASKIPRVQNGHGMMIVSTSQGLMTDEQARKARLGGELICEVR